MDRVLCFIYDDMADFEMTFSLHVLATRVEKEIINIAYEKQPVKSICEVLYQPLFTVKEALQLNYVDGLIIPGGFNNEQQPELTQLIKQLYAEQKLLAAICRGPSFLARAGVPTDKRYTTTFSEQVAKELGMEDPFDRDYYQERNVVRDGNVITAMGHAFVDFGIELCDYFKLFTDAQEKRQLANHYKVIQ